MAAEGYWADREADAILARGSGKPVVCTGISPSGPFHVGHLREILTGDALARALRERGAPARLVFVVDDLDPLRRVYPFLDRERFEPLVGRSLCELPAPEGEGRYDRYFLDPFLAALEKLGVEAEVTPASDLYGSGRMDEVVVEALEATARLREILAAVSGKEVPRGWSPWNPRCPSCRRLDGGTVLGHDPARGTVRSRCGHCGEEAEQPIREGGKLTWRVDWPARWKVLGVASEPFGKDHASRGGSWDSGRRISEEVFRYPPPHPLVYEWIGLGGGGDMSSSKGNVLSVADLVDIVPPEVLRYFVLRARPSRRITFDPGEPLLRLVDEVDGAAQQGEENRALHYSRAGRFRPAGVPFKHLVLVAQVAGFDAERARELLERGGYRDVDEKALAERLAMARLWLERFAPEEARVTMAERLPESARSLDPAQKRFLARLADALTDLDEPEAIHRAIRDLGREPDGPGVKGAFQAVYRALLGRDAGPRAGTYIALIGPERAARRFREAAAG